jgi:hypothetical protein
MQIQNPCSKVLTFFTATLLVLNSYIPNAKADSTEVLESNGIALNLNSIYGYKYGHMNVSQYSKSGEYDPEQQWNLRDLNDGTFLAESVSKPGECVNAHNPQVGSTVNIMPCDRNDPEQKLKKENGSIVLANYNLRLNLGDANDTVVKLTYKKVTSSYNQLGTKDENKQSQNSQTKDWSNDLNICSEASRQETRSENGDFVIVHLNTCGKYYVYMSPGASLELTHLIKNIREYVPSAEFGVGVIGYYEYLKKNPLTAPFWIAAEGFGVFYNSQYGVAVNDMEYCASKSKNMWFETVGGALFLNPTVKCD